MRLIRPLVCLFLLAAAITPAWCQDRASIVGRVTDPAGAVVAGAAVTVTNQGTGTKTATTTNQAGNYVVSSLPFGRYEVVCEAKGFRKFIARNNEVNIAQTVTLDIALQLGAVDQTVEVSGTAPLIESNTSDLG